MGVNIGRMGSIIWSVILHTTSSRVFFMIPSRESASNQNGSTGWHIISSNLRRFASICAGSHMGGEVGMFFVR